MATRLPPRAAGEADAAYVARLIRFELQHGCSNCASDESLRKIRRRLLRFFHPDALGEQKDADEQNRAIDEVLKQLDPTEYAHWKAEVASVVEDDDEDWLQHIDISGMADRLYDLVCREFYAAPPGAKKARKPKTPAAPAPRAVGEEGGARDGPSWGEREEIDVYDEQREGWVHRTVRRQVGRAVFLLPTEDAPPGSCDVSRTRRRTRCCEHIGGKSKRSFDNFSCRLACDHPGACLRPIVTQKRTRFATGLPFDADIKADVLNRFASKVATCVLTSQKSNTVCLYKRFFRAVLFGEHATLSHHLPACDNDSFVKNLFRLWGGSFERWSKRTVPRTDRRSAFDQGNGHAALRSVFEAGEERVQCLFEQSMLEAQR